MQTDIQFQLLIPQEHPCYADHFPNDALVPGALLMKWIVGQIETITYSKVDQIKTVKFLQSVRPGQLMQVSIYYSESKPNSFNLECNINNSIVIKGQMGYRNVLEKH